MNQDEIYLEKDGHLGWIMFNRPDVRNAMTWHMYDRLESLANEVEADDDIKVVVLRGVGGEAFVAGTDIRQFTDFSSGADGVDYEVRIDRVVERVERIAKPTIALLEGFCVGGGATIALACDFRYATPALKFGAPIARTLGNCLSMANISRLVDLLGVARTKEVLMLGTLADADTALHAGLVNALHPAERIEDAVRQVAERLTQNAPLTLNAVKEAVRRTQAHRRLPAEGGEDLIRSCYGSQDFRNAVRSFLDKTPHQWRGN